MDNPPETTSTKTIEEGIALFESVGMPARNLSARTRKEYGNDLQDLAAFLARRGIRELNQVDLPDLESYQAEMDKREYKSSTRRRKTLAIKVFFKFLHRHKVILKDVAAQLIPPRVVRNEPRFLSKEEYEALLRACSHHPRDAAIVELFLQTGMRLSELARLTVNDVRLPKKVNKDPENIGEVHIRRKGGKEDTIPLNFKACRALKTWMLVRPHISHEALFVSKFKRPLSKRAVQYVIQKYMQEIGVTDASVHSLRHTMATHHAISGTDAKTIQETLGHKSMTTTELYISMAKKEQRRALQEHAL